MRQQRRGVLIDWRLIVVLLLAVIVFIVISVAADRARQDIDQVAAANAGFIIPEEYGSLPAYEMRLLFGGDVMWGRQIERQAVALNNQDYGFEKLNTLNRMQYDAWIANVECPITDEIIPFDVQWEAITFNCPTKYVDNFAKWFDVASLANNHTDNINGEIGLQTTRRNLELVGVQHFGHYDPNVKEQLCEVVSLPIRNTVTQQSAGLFPIALCGYHGVFQVFTDEQIEVISEFADSFITFIMPHAGAEYQPDADELRRTAYRKMIDAGADAVFGNHPHWVQVAESYKGKPIIYSMGNFIFDQQFSPEVTRSALISVTIKLEGAITPWLQIAESCTSFGDSCADDATSMAVPAYGISYDVIGTRSTQFQARRANQADQLSILERMNWRQVSAQLQ